MTGLVLDESRLRQHGGLVQISHVALDATTISADLSTCKAISYGPMTKREDEPAEHKRWLLLADRAD